MTNAPHSLAIGLTSPHQCSYLSKQQERVAVVMDEEYINTQSYEVLLANGFRRSGDSIYRPHCDSCSACQSLRVSVADFAPSKSQRRIINQANRLGFHWQMKSNMDENWFAMYARYINARHVNGSMYPPNKSDFEQFSTNQWLNSQFLHIYQQEKLVAIAITDIMPACASAFYTFFDPDITLSLGTLAVLLQLDYCQQTAKQWLYLGYQIDECPAMNYKVRFQPHQRLVNQRWQG